MASNHHSYPSINHQSDTNSHCLFIVLQVRTRAAEATGARAGPRLRWAEPSEGVRVLEQRGHVVGRARAQVRILFYWSSFLFLFVMSLCIFDLLVHAYIL